MVKTWKLITRSTAKTNPDPTTLSSHPGRGLWSSPGKRGRKKKKKKKRVKRGRKRGRRRSCPRNCSTWWRGGKRTSLLRPPNSGISGLSLSLATSGHPSRLTRQLLPLSSYVLIFPNNWQLQLIPSAPSRKERKKKRYTKRFTWHVSFSLGHICQRQVIITATFVVISFFLPLLRCLVIVIFITVSKVQKPLRLRLRLRLGLTGTGILVWNVKQDTCDAGNHC